jgi:hypothetical protein
MKKFLIIACSAALSSSSTAQMNIGAKGGFGINSLTHMSSSDKAFFGVQISAFSKIPIGNSFFLQPSLGYYPKGKRRLDVTLYDDLGNPVGSVDVTSRTDFAELAVPLQFPLHSGNIQWLAGLGPFFSYALGGRNVYKNVSGWSSELKNDKIVFGKYGKDRGDVGATLLFSAIYRTKWVASLNYDQGLIHYEKTVSVGLSIGYFFK